MNTKKPAHSAAPGRLIPDSGDTGDLIRVIPNPLRGRGEVRLDVPATGPMKIELVDLSGKHTLQLFEGEYSGGVRTIFFDAGPLPSDAYICIVEIGDRRFHRLVMVDR